jgi:hypothetical protein
MHMGMGMQRMAMRAGVNPRQQAPATRGTHMATAMHTATASQLQQAQGQGSAQGMQHQRRLLRIR